MRQDVFVFIDESGDPGEHGSAFLVIAAMWVEDPVILERLMKRIRSQKRFARFLQKTNELHASSSDDDFRLYVLGELAKVEGLHAYAVILDKRKVYSTFLKANKHKLYNYVSGDLVSKWEISGRHLIIRIDKSKGNQVLQEDFNRYVKEKVQRAGRLITADIFHSYSHAWYGLQFVDYISWAVFRWKEYGDARFFNIIQDKTGTSYVWKEK
jgi:hypothetical protein